MTDARTQRERMLAGEPYLANDPELVRLSRRAIELCEEYNRTSVTAPADRTRILRELLASVGEGVEIRPPFHCDYGSQIRIGARTFVNFGLVGVIVCPGVSIGANTVVGAGAVVVRDLPANVVAVGNPARIVRNI